MEILPNDRLNKAKMVMSQRLREAEPIVTEFVLTNLVLRKNENGVYLF